MKVINKNAAPRMDLIQSCLLIILCVMTTLKFNEILVKSMVKSTKNIKISKSMCKTLKLVTC